MTPDARERVRSATVRLPKLGGQGVLVSGGFVLTATHCVEWEGTGGMALGDHHVEPIETKSGATFRLAPAAADPVSDLAVLGALDDQAFSREDCDAFEDWANAAAPVALSGAFGDWCAPVELGKSQAFRVHVLAHTGEWITGEASRIFVGREASSRVWVDTVQPLRGGTSGGPIVDDAGRLVAVVSFSGEVEQGESSDGAHPFVANALPHWVRLRVGFRARRRAPLRQERHPRTAAAADSEGSGRKRR